MVEQATTNIARMDLWREAKGLLDLHSLLEPAGGHTIAAVYNSLLEFERRETDKKLHGRKSQVLPKKTKQKA